MHDIQKKLHDQFLNKDHSQISGVKGVGTGSAADGIKYYRGSYLINLRESMDDRFKVFSKVVPNYQELREKFIFENPSTYYSLDDYGLNFSDWLKSNQQDSLLIGLAILEQELDLFTRKKINANSVTDFTKLSPGQKLHLSHASLLSFSKSVYTLWDRQDRTVSMDDAQEVLIYYSGKNVMVKLLKKWEFALLGSFEHGADIEEALSHFQPTNADPSEIQAFFSFLASFKLLT